MIRPGEEIRVPLEQEDESPSVGVLQVEAA
jgi:hypothetical protein